MRRIIFVLILVFFLIFTAYAQEAGDYPDNNYYDTGMAGGLTVYGERTWDSDSIDAHILDQLNGSLSVRKRLIETEFLEESGFRRTGNVQYRRTNSSEKASSIFHGIGHMFSFGIVPMKPFSEVEFNRLPRGEYYRFQSVLIKSNFINIAPEILTLMELEYMLQIEFCNGIVIQDNVNYYTDDNINKFERIIHRLPDIPEIRQAKNRYLNELQKIKAALQRYRNPSEDYLRAIENLGDSFNNNRFR
jgi:hypothetical protein